MQKERDRGREYDTFASVRLVQGRDWYTGESSDGRQMGTQRSLALVCSLYAVCVACEESTTKSVMLSQSGAAVPLTPLGSSRCARVIKRKRKKKKKENERAKEEWRGAKIPEVR